MTSLFLKGVFIILFIYIIGMTPALTVSFTAITIVLSFLIFGKE